MLNNRQDNRADLIINSGISKERYEKMIEGGTSLGAAYRKTIEKDAADALNGQDKPITKAVISEHAIFCGKCNHKMAGVKNLRAGLGNGTIFLICKHKSASRVCKTINEIEL